MTTQSSAEAAAGAGTLARGATVGRYVILDLVGRGGMGEVYAAYDPRLDRKVALKLLNDTAGRGTAGREAQERLLREAQATARLHHPNVVVVHDAGAFDDVARGVRVYLAMEFIEGPTLAEWVAAEPRPWRAVVDVFTAAGEGLLAAHEAALVHRDFKPQNVMIARDGTPRVTDFGLASDAGAVDEVAAAFDPTRAGTPAPTTKTLALTHAGVLLGTPLYMAPEQFLGRPTDARTDQFAFCVALYEALYAERPFPSDSASGLVAAVTGGRVRPPPSRARVPAALRGIVLRGLRPLPTERYSSMRELIAALRVDPTRVRRRAAVATTLALGLVLGATATARMATHGRRMCGGAADKLTGIWDLDTGGARRTAVHRAFAATGRSFAEETWTRASALLDDYSRRWVEAHTDTCEATHVRGDQSGDVLDLRMACLESSRRALRALTDVFTHADGTALVSAIDAIRSLPPIERCADVPALRAVIPPPTDAATRARVAVLEGRLAHVKALSNTGGWKEARDEMTALVEAARAIGYEPLLAEALDAEAWLIDELGDPRGAYKTYHEAVWIALAAHQDEVAARSATELVSAYGRGQGSRSESERWDHLAEALLERLGPGQDRTVAWLHQNRGLVLYRAGNYPGAVREIELALALKERILPPTDPDIAISLLARSSVAQEAGKYEAALDAAQKGLTIESAAYGAGSPLLCDGLMKRGQTLTFFHRYREAEDDLRSCVTRLASYLGAEDPVNAYPLTGLGKVLVAEGKFREAAPVLEEALRLHETAVSLLPDDLAETRFALAQAHWALNRDRPGARALAIAARDAYRSLPGKQRRVAEIEAWLASK